MTDSEQRGQEKRQKGPRGIRAAGPPRRGGKLRVTGSRGLRAGEVEEEAPTKEGGGSERGRI